MRQNTRKGRYFSFLLRLWETTDGERSIWRATVEIPATGEQYSFASLDDLYLFLLSQIDPGEAPPDCAG
jgi:hypothetical protein